MKAEDMVKRIDQYAVFFERLDRHISLPSEVTQTRLFELFGAEGLRKNFYIVSYFVERLSLRWSGDELQGLVEQSRVAVQLKRWQGQPWSSALHVYVVRLRASERAVSDKTVRVYVNAAARWLQHAGVGSPRELTADHLTRFLKGNPGQRASLARFLSYLREEHGVSIVVKQRSDRSGAKQDKKLVVKARALLSALGSEVDVRRERALLVASISHLYQIPIKRVLALSKHDAQITDDTITLWPNDLKVVLLPEVAKILKKFVVHSESELVFVGRNRVQALSYDAVRHHVQQALTETNRSRARAGHLSGSRRAT